MKIKLRLCEDDELDMMKKDIVDSEGEKVEEPKMEEEKKDDAPVAVPEVAPTPVIAPLEAQAEPEVVPAIPDAAPEVAAVVDAAPVAAPEIPAPINIEIITPGAEPIANIAEAPACPEGECCPAAQAADIACSSNSINQLIKGEWDAIDLYNSMIPLFTDKGLTDAVNTINDIIAEEYVHIGQLEGLLKTIDMNANSIAEGEAEHAGVPETLPAAMAVGMVK